MKRGIVKHWFRAIRNVGNTPHPSPMATPSPRRGRLGVFDLMAGAMAAGVSEAFISYVVEDKKMPSVPVLKRMKGAEKERRRVICQEKRNIFVMW